MGFAKSSKKAEDVKQASSGYITRSGVYHVNILVPFVNTSEAGSSVVDMFLEHEGQQQALYGNLRVTNKKDESGEDVPNKIGAKIFNQMLIIADVDSVGDAVEADLPIGKGGIDKKVAILEDLADTDIMIRIQMEYSMWKNSIQERKVIKGFYRVGDNATAEEVVNDTQPGKGYEGDKKYFDNVTYKDDLTEDDIVTWIKGGRKPGGASGTGKPTEEKVKPGLGKKRSFGKK